MKWIARRTLKFSLGYAAILAELFFILGAWNEGGYWNYLLSVGVFSSFQLFFSIFLWKISHHKVKGRLLKLPSSSEEGLIVGFRQWLALDDKLISITGEISGPFKQSIWKVGVNEAECRYYSNYTIGDHKSPQAECYCGYYFFNQPVWCNLFADNFVIGACLCWGKTIRHQEGFRAEYARPILLVGNPAQDNYEQIKKLAKAYDCRVVNVTNEDVCYSLVEKRPSPLEIAAREYGRVIEYA
jgi:hypothetical protein